MKELARYVVVAAIASAMAACALDFAQAIPCDSSDNCPGGMVCNADIRRCLPGEREDTPDTDDDVRDDIIEDAIADADVADGSGGDATIDDVRDAASDGSGADAGGDVLSDVLGDTSTCTPVAEICDGLDQDCDGVADNGLTCGPCPAGMVHITRGTPFCIDTYEASRQDATATEHGVDNSIATSRVGVMPWRAPTFAEAEAACTAAGKRLCTGAEWTGACGGPTSLLYPYGSSYRGDACNGVNVPPLDRPVPTGQFAACVSGDGTFDQSGNLSEWTSDQAAWGGAYRDVEVNLRCPVANRSINPTVPDQRIGFRCCAAPR